MPHQGLVEVQELHKKNISLFNLPHKNNNKKATTTAYALEDEGQCNVKG